ncbi:MAG: formylglycine-generating enzyme family protein, partial [Prochloraceae cyanobacterium]
MSGEKIVEFEVLSVDKRGNIIQLQTKKAEYFTQDLGNGVTLDMVAIRGGKFLMGSPTEEEGSFDCERPQHEVTIQPFWMSKFPVTQALWRAIAELPKVDRHLNLEPSSFQGDNLPVESVSWYDAVEFCSRLSRETGRSYRLPSEAEWEYAARAGTTTPFHCGETIETKLANYRGSATYANEPQGEYRGETTPVGSFPPNAFGLYDMHGNVWEWCADIWHDNYSGA